MNVQALDVNDDVYGVSGVMPGQTATFEFQFSAALGSGFIVATTHGDPCAYEIFLRTADGACVDLAAARFVAL